MKPYFLVLLLPLAVAAQSPYLDHTLRLDAPENAPQATIEDIAWLSAYWQGECFDQPCQELWAPPQLGRMYGVFTLANETGYQFTEKMVLMEEDGSLSLKLKHFTADFVGWETRDQHVTFRLVKIGENKAWFDGLTFERRDDELLIHLVLKNQGEISEHAMRLTRRAM